MLICELPDPVPSGDDDVIDDVTDRPTPAVSLVTSYCERPRNLLHPVDLCRRRRRRRRKPYNDTDEPRFLSPSSGSNEYLVDFAVCVPPLFGNVSVTELVEFIEVNQKTFISLYSSDILNGSSQYRDGTGSPGQRFWPDRVGSRVSVSDPVFDRGFQF